MKTAFVVAVVLTVAVYLAPRGEGQSTSNQPQQKHADERGAVTPAQQEANRHQEKDKSTTNQSPQGYQTSQWALVVVGIVTFVIVGWQAYESRRSVEIAKRSMVSQFRPRIHVREIKMDGSNHAVKITLANIGGSVAHIKEVRIELKVVAAHASPVPLSPTYIRDSFSIQPGEDPSPIVAEFNGASDTFAYFYAIEGTANTALQCEGFIRYADDNQTLRKTGFLRRYTKPTGIFSTVSPEYEYED